jgi:hypothetical protein
MAGYRIGPVRLFGLLGGAFEFNGISESYNGDSVTINNSSYTISGIPSFSFYLYTGAGFAVKLWRIVLRSDVQYTILKTDMQKQNQTIFSVSTGYAF